MSRERQFSGGICLVDAKGLCRRPSLNAQDNKHEAGGQDHTSYHFIKVQGIKWPVSLAKPQNIGAY